MDYTEFITAMISKKVLLKKENLKGAFMMIDRDGSGYISVDELKSAFDS